MKKFFAFCLFAIILITICNATGIGPMILEIFDDPGGSVPSVEIGR